MTHSTLADSEPLRGLAAQAVVRRGVVDFSAIGLLVP
jgi:hypothetical protein